MADSQIPWGIEALGGTINEPAWKSKPSWYLVATDDKMIPPPAQRFMSNRAGSTVVEVAGSHAIYVSQPNAVAALIEKAARELVSFLAWRVLNIVPRYFRVSFCRRERIDLNRWACTIARDVSFVLLAVCLMLSVKETKDSRSRDRNVSLSKSTGTIAQMSSPSPK
jgi:hypothetical protein